MFDDGAEQCWGWKLKTRLEPKNPGGCDRGRYEASADIWWAVHFRQSLIVKDFPRYGHLSHYFFVPLNVGQRTRRPTIPAANVDTTERERAVTRLINFISNMLEFGANSEMCHCVNFWQHRRNAGEVIKALHRGFAFVKPDVCYLSFHYTEAVNPGPGRRLFWFQKPDAGPKCGFRGIFHSSREQSSRATLWAENNEYWFSWTQVWDRSLRHLPWAPWSRYELLLDLLRLSHCGCWYVTVWRACGRHCCCHATVRCVKLEHAKCIYLMNKS